MRFLIQILLVVFWAISMGQAHAGIRCGNDLISEGETSFEVQIKLAACGSIFDKQLVASSTETKKKGDGEVEKEILIERWYIRVSERGGIYCYPLIFEQGILKEIGSWQKCK